MVNGKTRYVNIEIHILNKKEKILFKQLWKSLWDFTYISDVIKNLKILLFMNLKKHEI